MSIQARIIVIMAHVNMRYIILIYLLSCQAHQQANPVTRKPKPYIPLQSQIRPYSPSGRPGLPRASSAFSALGDPQSGLSTHTLAKQAWR